MRMAVINGPLVAGAVIVNVIEAEEGFELPGKMLVEAGNAGIGHVWNGEAFNLPALVPPTTDDIDAERDRRIEAGFTFAGKSYQSRDQDRENISGASLAALAAMMNGAQPEDFRWHGGDSDFVWIAEDNTLTPMDAQTVFSFGQAAMAHKQAHIFAARALKDADPIPADYVDDGWWP